ncbi:hypothetical protein [Dolichospermum phage Dfl-JY23]
MRKLIGTIRHLDTEPWKNASLFLTLINGTYTSVDQYPIDTKHFKTDKDGKFEVFVIPNTGLQESYYVLTTPDSKKHAFTIPDGTSDIDFSVVREAGIVVNNPNYNNILNFLTNYINDAIAGIQASSVIAELFTCGQTVSALKALRYDVTTGKVFYASSNDITHLNKCVGISNESGVLNDVIQVITSGYITDNSWNWTIGQPIFFNSEGTLTHTPGTAYYQQIGIPVTPNKILVSIGQPIQIIDNVVIPPDPDPDDSAVLNMWSTSYYVAPPVLEPEPEPDNSVILNMWSTSYYIAPETPSEPEPEPEPDNSVILNMWTATF